jgi:hypothetical protein
MKTFINLGLAASIATLTLADLTEHSPVHVGDLKVKRGFLTCQETYGGGSITCGDSNSHFCYDPTLGEVSPPVQSPLVHSSDQLFRAVASSTMGTAKQEISAPL